MSLFPMGVVSKLLKFNDSAEGTLECGGSTPPWNHVQDELFKAASSRRTPRCPRCKDLRIGLEKS